MHFIVRYISLPNTDNYIITCIMGFRQSISPLVRCLDVCSCGQLSYNVFYLVTILFVLSLNPPPYYTFFYWLE